MRPVPRPDAPPQRIFGLLRHPFQRRVLLVDTDGADSTAAEILSMNGRRNYHLLGVCRFGKGGTAETAPVTDGHAEWPASLRSTESSSLPSVGLHDIREIARQHNMTTLVLRSGPTLDLGLLQVLIDCVERGIEVIPASRSAIEQKEFTA